MTEQQVDFVVFFILAILGCAMANLCTYLLLHKLVNYFVERKSDPAHTLSDKDKGHIFLYLLGLLMALGRIELTLKSIFQIWR